MREKHNSGSEEEKEERIVLLSGNLENLADVLFGDEAIPEEIELYLEGLDDAKSAKFVELVNEAMDFDY